MARSDRGEGGFVLLEVLIALVVFATIVLAWARSTDDALEGAARANAERTLRMLAARKLAEVRAKPAEYLEGDEGGFEEEVDFGDANPFLDYHWRVESEEKWATPSREEEEGIGYVFPRDGEEGAWDQWVEKEKTGSARPEKLLQVTLTVTHVPGGWEEGEEFRVVTYLLPEDEEEEGDR